MDLLYQQGGRSRLSRNGGVVVAGSGKKRKGRLNGGAESMSFSSTYLRVEEQKHEREILYEGTETTWRQTKEVHREACVIKRKNS